MKKSFALCVQLTLLLLVCACDMDSVKQHLSFMEKKPEKRQVKAVVVFDSDARFDDHSFSEMASRGADEAEKKLGIKVSKILQPKDKSREGLLRFLIADGYNHIIGIGYQSVLPAIEVSRDNIDVKFTVIDGRAPTNLANVKSVKFKDQEGAFLVGMIAAEKSASGKIGFIGAMDIPLIRNFASGFEDGARYAKNNIIFASETIETTANPWNDPAAGEKAAQNLFNSGSDVVFAAAGTTGIGVLKAANERGKFAIGVDFNQNGIYPGKVLTSMVKRVDLAVLATLEDDVDEKWQAGVHEIGLAEKAVDYVIDENNQKLISSDLRDRVEKARQSIIAGKLKVYSYKEKHQQGGEEGEKDGSK